MLRQLRICKKCINKLGKYGNMPLDFYVLCCELYAGDTTFSIEGLKLGSGGAVIRFLENKKFIVTFDYDKERLAVKPIGFNKKKSRYLESYTVCAFREEHNKKGRSTEVNLPQH